MDTNSASSLLVFVLLVFQVRIGVTHILGPSAALWRGRCNREGIAGSMRMKRLKKDQAKLVPVRPYQ